MMQIKRLALAIWAAGFAGPSLAQTVNCDLAQDTASMGECLQKQYDAADSLLNVAYKAAMADMKAIDEGLPKSDKGAQMALKSGQRAWIDMRDGTCAAEGFQWVGGSGRGIAIMSCLLAQTEARIEVLTALAQYD